MTMKQADIHVVGIGPLGPSRRALEIIGKARTLIGDARLAARLSITDVPAIRPISPVRKTIEMLENRRYEEPVTILASGDPLFFGIGRILLERLGPGHISFLPAETSIQWACARLKLPWNDLVTCSLHGRDKALIETIYPFIAGRDSIKIGLLTDRHNDPARIAADLLEAGFRGLTIHVAEDLGGENERISSLDLERATCMDFHPLNVVILTGRVDWPAGQFGRNEEVYQHSEGLITKAEIRSIILGLLELPATGVLWDIGAGSGSVSIEAGGLRTALSIFAIERDKSRVMQIHNNVLRFKTANVRVVQGDAPGILGGLPAPDRIFLGGGGGRLAEILEFAASRLKKQGILVASAITLRSLNILTTAAERLFAGMELCQVGISRSRSIGKDLFLAPLNPIFILKAWL